jgi:hypothetical protein
VFLLTREAYDGDGFVKAMLINFLSLAGLPDFSLNKIPKQEKNIKLPQTTYTKGP